MFGCDPRRLRQTGDTPLVLAVCMEHWPCAHLLLARGGAAALRVRDALGWTPVHHAIAGPSNPTAAAWLEAASKADGLLRAAAETEVAAAAAAAAVSAGSGALERFRGTSGSVQVGPEGLILFKGFSTVWAGCFCTEGAKGYYEVEVLTEQTGSQWGFCIGGWPRVEGLHGSGVGHDGDSWAVDGHRGLKWHGAATAPRPFGRRWLKGDVIGLACELPPAAAGGGGRVLASVNGDFSPPNGVAFDLPPGLAGLHPALSCVTGVVRCNLGGDPARPHRHAPPTADYQAMAAFPPPPIVALAVQLPRY